MLGRLEFHLILQQLLFLRLRSSLEGAVCLIEFHQVRGLLISLVIFTTALFITVIDALIDDFIWLERANLSLFNTLNRIVHPCTVQAFRVVLDP